MRQVIGRHNAATRAASMFLGVALAAAMCGSAAFAQTTGAMQGLVKQRLADIKASAAQNQRRLHDYTWTETSEITVDGRTLPPRVSNCRYGTDGKIQKTPVAGTTGSKTNQGGLLRRRIIEKKKAEIKGYMTQVERVIRLYVPPNPQKLQQAFQEKKATFERNDGLVDLTFRNYALNGDVMTLGFDPAARRIRTLAVHSYVGTPADTLNLGVDFASLPDGTNHPSRTTLDAPAKGIHVVNTNSNYRKSSP